MTDKGSLETKEDRRERRKRRKEAESLELNDHKNEAKRLRAYSTEKEESPKKNPDGSSNDGITKRRTRSIDAAEKHHEEIELSTEAWLQEHSITIQRHGNGGTDYPDPFRQFEQTPFNDRVQQGFQRAGFKAPTAIQSQAWPIALQGEDMICIAKTGSGKTCGFLLPAFHLHLTKNTRIQGFTPPMLLVLAPTRELSVQIMEEAQKFGRPLGIRSVCCYGGSPKYAQIQALSRGVECVIATPGRLNDLLEMKKVSLEKVSFLVLDEADRMLDMGFEPQIRSIVKHVPNERQTLLFSATWPREIQTLAHDFLKDPIQVNVGEVGALVANKDITQKISVCMDHDKLDKLIEILKELVDCNNTSDSAPNNGTRAPIAGGGKDHVKIIVFVAKKISCHDLANQLWDQGYAVDSLHGDRPQWERTRVMGAFKSGQLRMLIATDVAARGLDVKDVGVVVNYDMPTGVNGVEDYIHRIGRTGRAGKKGKAYTFFTPGDKKQAAQLVQVLEKAEQEIPAELQAMVPRRRFGGGRGGGRGYTGGSRGGRGYMSGGRGGGRGYMGGGGGFRGRGRGGRGGGRHRRY